MSIDPFQWTTQPNPTKPKTTQPNSISPAQPSQAQPSPAQQNTHIDGDTRSSLFQNRAIINTILIHFVFCFRRNANTTLCMLPWCEIKIFIIVNISSI